MTGLGDGIEGIIQAFLAVKVAQSYAVGRLKAASFLRFNPSILAMHFEAVRILPRYGKDHPDPWSCEFGSY